MEAYEFTVQILHYRTKEYKSIIDNKKKEFLLLLKRKNGEGGTEVLEMGVACVKDRLRKRY